jgi:tetratricopeptide (TPR) repeat protein
MAFPTPHEIKNIAAGKYWNPSISVTDVQYKYLTFLIYCFTDHGYIERKEETSRTLFFKERNHVQQIILINVFYTTRGIMTKIPHPTSGYNELWRSTAYDSIESLIALFTNPRSHTGKGYRKAEKAVRGCSNCGLQKERSDFSKNQWRKGPDQAKCSICVQEQKHGQDDIEISYECLECDADGCSQSCTIQCSICKSTYYCAEACQNRHKPSHSDECRMTIWIKEKFLESPSEPVKNVTAGIALAAMLAGRRDFKGTMLQAEYYESMGNCEGAIELYKSIYDELPDRSPPEQRQYYMNLSRCFYHVGRYDDAIFIGMVPIEMNRRFDEVHKYVALAHKAKGDIDTARRLMKQAVLYETPWNEKNIEANKALLKQI